MKLCQGISELIHTRLKYVTTNGMEYRSLSSDGALTLHQLQEKIEEAVRMTSYFSIVMKLGRVASRRCIHLYYLDPNHAADIEKWTFDSVTWSFENDSIISETIPFKAHFLMTPETKTNSSDDNLAALRRLKEDHCIFKHLGVRIRTDGADSTATGKAKCRGAIRKINKINIHKIHDKACVYIMNALITADVQFAALEATVTMEDMCVVERAALNKVHRAMGMGRKDMKEIIYTWTSRSCLEWVLNHGSV